MSYVAAHSCSINAIIKLIVTEVFMTVDVY